MTRDEKVIEILKTGAEIAGGVTGAAISLYSGSPEALLFGAALNPVIKNLFLDFTNRTLSRREEIKIGAAADFAIVKIAKYLESGLKPRNDDFFDYDVNKRSNADEIFEGVLLKCKQEHEEKKIPFISNIFVNTAFSQDFSVSEANFLLSISENITYRKMCILSIFERNSFTEKIKLKNNPYHNITIPFETASILQEIYELVNMGLLNSTYSLFIANWTQLVPNKTELSNLGKRYCTFMGLEDIDEEDLKLIVNYLK